MHSMHGYALALSVTEVLDSYGALQQTCGVATRGGAALQLVLTDLHTLLHPPTALPSLQMDEGKAGKDGDNQAIILAPKAKEAFKVQREKKSSQNSSHAKIRS